MTAPSHVLRAVDEELTRPRVLRVDGDEVVVRPIGEGSFAEVYRAVDPPRDVYALLDPSVRDKDIAAMVHGDLPENPHVPAVEWAGYDDDGDKVVYRMPYYRVPPPDGSAAEETRLRLSACTPRQAVDPGAQRRDVIACARRFVDMDVPPSVVEALERLSEEAAQTDAGYVFEFGRENTAVNEDGELVLLDVLYPEYI